MKKVTLALLGMACLMAMPSIAQARYRDGMNLYQYVASNPTRFGDPAGCEKVGFDLQVDVTHKITGLEGKVNGLFAPLIPALREGMSQANRGLPLLQLTATDQFRMSDMPAGAAASLSVTGSSQQSGRISGWTGIPLLLTVSVQGNAVTTGKLQGGFVIEGECSDYCVKGSLKLRDLQLKMRVEMEGGGINLNTGRRDLTFAFNTCSSTPGKRVANGSKHVEFKGDDSLSYDVSVPLVNLGEGLVGLGGLIGIPGADETAAQIRREREQALQMVRSAIKSVQRDQFWDDVDMELTYEVFSN